MKALIPVKLPSSTKSYQKVVKCTVYLDIHAITCPGALLAQSEEVYLSVCVMGQYRKTHCAPPAFPLLFNHKMVFVRTFPGVVDPADVSEQLESDTSTFELIQTVPPEGEILATVEEGTRDFVFPGPRLTSRGKAPERQILMRKSSSFPGTAPIVVEFATTAVVEEIDGAGGQPTTPDTALHHAAAPPNRIRQALGARAAERQRGSEPRRFTPRWSRRSPYKTASPPLHSKSPLCSAPTMQHSNGDHRNHSPSETDKEKVAHSVWSSGPSPPCQRGRGEPPSPEVSGYRRPTVASASHALSPYTHRRMCELSEDAWARLAHLRLGPHHFKKHTESQPPFLVPCCSDVSVSESPSQRVSTPRASSLHRSGSARLTADHPDSSLLGSYRPKLAKSLPCSTRTGLSPGVQRRWRGEEGETVTPVGAARSIPGAPSSRSPVDLEHLSLGERSHAGLHRPPSHWEQIHSRVQRILRTHGASPPQHLVVSDP
ncbi:hypothetical protein NHX12_033349 [Muraenolepis orangiensis]|uniref:Spermatogenesis-associated protein 6 N-terminal domain-containing protein n=1 Tax=Muraenolepis orangiensis TaxID=630683 RepID=A0A9Q0E4X5_9TELE|nr:hypothetical protein NHX12_033349 [Muraenolepis orangiensis]